MTRIGATGADPHRSSNMSSVTAIRDYRGVLGKLRAPPDRAAAMSHVCDLLWDAFGLDSAGQGPAGARMSWVGFYEKSPAADEMILVARRDKPACSPIGLHGCCGRSFTSRRGIVVRDVATLGAGYIACDPRDKSEVVVPLFEAGGSCWGVLDVDSYEAGAFDEHDARGLAEMMERAGLSAPGFSGPVQHL